MSFSSQGVRGTPGDRGETGQEGEAVSSAAESSCCFEQFKCDGLCNFGCEWLIHSLPTTSPRVHQESRDTRALLDIREWRYVFSLTLLYSLLGQTSHHSVLTTGKWRLNRSRRSSRITGSPGMKKGGELSLLCFMTFRTQRPLLNSKSATSWDHLHLCTTRMIYFHIHGRGRRGIKNRG